VYVPFALFSDVPVHDAANVPDAQIFVDVATSVVPAPGVSLLCGWIVWIALKAPVDVSGVAVGGGTTVGVSVAVAFCPPASVTLYVIAGAVPE